MCLPFDWGLPSSVGSFRSANRNPAERAESSSAEPGGRRHKDAADPHSIDQMSGNGGVFSDPEWIPASGGSVSLAGLRFSHPDRSAEFAQRTYPSERNCSSVVESSSTSTSA